MSDAEAPHDAPPKKSSKILILLSFTLSLGLAGGSYWAVTHLGIFHSESHTDAKNEHINLGGTPAFVPIDAIVVSLEHEHKTHHLRFKAELDVPEAAEDDVIALMPRIVDVLNTFLRALSLEDIKHPSALTKIRSQMLRRVKIVLGEHQVNDILVMEFVIN